MPTLVGPVEFGSFTRWPRTGNPGVVLWRDPATRSTQNRIGLRNPGARAAAEFLARRLMPPVYGINIAASPGVTEREQEAREIGEAFDLFLDRDLRPAWFTLNLSCPNTEDDPGARQTEEQARDLCGAAADRVREVNIPLWVKIGPCLSEAQYTALMRVFADTGVRAVIATNTMPQPTPEAPGVVAGVGGGRLHAAALDSVRMLARIRREFGHKTDIIGCGGVIDPTSFIAIQNAGAGAAQYWSALIYRGPLAAALILDDRPQNERNIAL
jgi:dihydroorotate dehydrogenase